MKKTFSIKIWSLLLHFLPNDSRRRVQGKFTEMESYKWLIYPNFPGAGYPPVK